MMKILNAGAIRLGYENGFLRRISYAGSEIVRMIYFALRDHNWNTMVHEIANEEIEVLDGGFRITYNSRHLDGGVAVMAWKVSIAGHPDGSIIFEIDGKMLEDFRKNRAGFCLLHPLQAAGTNCQLLHDDGSSSTVPFPVEISPTNPFKNVRSMKWKAGQQEFSVSFEGDSFELEDQRNWGDASFKTFCTPLEKPFPVQMKKGDKVFQRIIFKAETTLSPVAVSGGPINLRSVDDRAVVPRLGVAASSEAERIPANAVDALKKLRLSHYRVDLYPGAEPFATDFSRACEDAFSLGLPLEAVLHLTDGYAEEIEKFSVICRQNKVRLGKILLLKEGTLVTPEEVLDQVPALKNTFPTVLIGGGTDYNFNEINKNHFRADALDFISFSLNPQEHAFDDLTILENTETGGHMVRSTRAIYGHDMAVHISPLTMRKRFNPYATNPADIHVSESLRVEPRQKLTLGALWTFGALCSLAKGGAASVTLYQTVGNQGIMGVDGIPFPLYEAIRLFAPYQGKPVEFLQSSDPLAVTAVVVDNKMLMLANHSGKEIQVSWNDAVLKLAPGEIRTEGR